MRPLSRDLILQTSGGDPLERPCCKGTMKPVRKVNRCEEIEFFLRLRGIWEGIVMLPCPPTPPFDIATMEPIKPPWGPCETDTRATWQVPRCCPKMEPAEPLSPETRTWGSGK
jgi:hypothetical protein